MKEQKFKLSVLISRLVINLVDSLGIKSDAKTTVKILGVVSI